MTREELRIRLKAMGVRSDAYSLSGNAGSEMYVLERCYGVWRVCYSERGKESRLTEFDSESDACVHLLSLLREDGAVR